MGGERRKSRLQDRVHFTSTHKTKGTGHQTTCQRISKERSSYRSRLSPREGSHLQDRTPLPEGLSVKFRPGSQEDGGLATHSESKTTESVHKTKEIQNGVIVGGPQSTHKGSRGHVNRPKGPYLHIPIHRDHQRWLRFQIQGQAYAFRSDPFRHSTSPRVFTRVVKNVGAFLRRHGVQIHLYPDDWLITSQSLEQASLHTDLVLQTVSRLGFIVNSKKSNLQTTLCPSSWAPG